MKNSRYIPQFFGFWSIRSIVILVVLGLTFLGCQGIRAMQTPFFDAQAAVAPAIIAELKRGLGFDGQKAAYKSKKLSEKAAERMASKEYAVQLQRFASALYEQDRFFAVLAAHFAVLTMIHQYYQDRDALTAQENMPAGIAAQRFDSGDGRQYIQINTMSREAFIVALRYRSLLLSVYDPALLPDLRAAAAVLEHTTDTGVAYLCGMLALKVRLSECQGAFDRSKKLIADAYTHVRSVHYVPSFNSSDRSPVDAFMAQCLYLLEWAIRAPSVGIFNNRDSTDNALHKYREKRAMFAGYYVAAIAELNALMRAGIIESSSGLVLERSTEYLPGCVGSTVQDKISTVTQASSSTQTALADDLSWADAPETAQAPLAEKKIKKKKKKDTARVQQAITVSFAVPEADRESDDEQEFPAAPYAQKSPIAAESIPSAMLTSPDDALTVRFPVSGHATVRAWVLYRVTHQNSEPVPQLPLRYSRNVQLWQVDPEEALHTQGYYTSNAKKHAAAHAFARKRQEPYVDDVQMRTAISIYHAFPQELDGYIRQYGRLEIKEVPHIQGASRLVEPRLCITMAGELELHNKIIRGLFCYVIDPATGVCYHRMFEPATKNPLALDFYDIYFLSTE